MTLGVAHKYVRSLCFQEEKGVGDNNTFFPGEEWRLSLLLEKMNLALAEVDKGSGYKIAISLDSLILVLTFCKYSVWKKSF